MNSSFKRFQLLFRKQWIEERRLYLLGILVMGLLLQFLMLLTVFTADYGLDSAAVGVMFILGLLLCGTIFSSGLLNRFQHKSEAIFTLMTPASATEKLAVALVYGLVLFPVVYALLFAGNFYIARLVEMKYHASRFQLKNVAASDLFSILIFYWLAQGVVLLITLSFRRYVFLISAGLLICIAIVGSALSQPLLKKMIGTEKPALTEEVKMYGREIIAAKLDNSNPLGDATFQLDVKVGEDSYTPRRTVYVRTTLSTRSFILFNGFVLTSVILVLYIVWLRLKEQQL
ncbi:hypothetical protein MKQ70_23300 [Chitinophaga sedimenti]|uniref:hypothetical protein n=1 Tax=Chitinophaga sedimenti TaxID=2033606 RepID=UPI002004593D|nr:hypothetical protein [Chitinophaga sedimenti]MCK7557774.1 hypothetical protein [Chitinophaga sedimenti]